MKPKSYLLYLLVLTSLVSLCQQKPKPKDKEKAPSQQEIDAMLREAQMEINNMSTEDKKKLDSMGVKMPPMNSIPTFSDKQLQEVNNNTGSFIIPKKDVARISSVNRKPMTNSELVVFLKTTVAEIEQRMVPLKLTSSKQAYSEIKAKYDDPNAVSVAASGYWMLGVLQPAIYLMGRACQDDPNNPDHLNNYAAFLTMAQVEHLALPILIKLNRNYPRNSTILNNLGHAWLGLGDISLAEKYLDSAILLYPNHSQANYTKALLANSRGNTQGAITGLKRSLSRAYSESKKTALDELGYKLKGSDLHWNLRMPQEALLVSTYEWPNYPKTTVQSVELKPEWDAYGENLVKQGIELETQQRVSEGQIEEDLQNKIQAALKLHDIGQLWLAKKASIMLEYTLTARSGAMNKLKQKETELENAYKMVEDLQKQMELDLANVHEEFKPLMGEGKQNPFKAYCAKLTAIQDAFLGSVNPKMESAYKGYIEAYQKMANEKIYYQQFIFSEVDFEMIKIQEKAHWLAALSKHPVFMEMPNQSVCPKIPERKGSSKVLAEFNDLNCKNIIDFDIIIAKWRKACDNSTIDVGVGPINLNVAYNDWKEEIIRGSMEIGTSKGIGTSSGPMKAELEGKLSGFVEFDKEGLTDVGIVASVEAKTGVEVETGSDVIKSVGNDLISVGISSRIGWNSGGSIKVFNN
jgi:tetratricopeptide (TPR) repeat protein